MFFVFSLYFLIFFLIPFFAKSQEFQKILISEVYYYPDDQHKIAENDSRWFEWIEIWNIGEEAIDIKGWEICELQHRNLAIRKFPIL